MFRRVLIVTLSILFSFANFAGEPAGYNSERQPDYPIFSGNNDGSMFSLTKIGTFGFSRGGDVLGEVTTLFENGDVRVYEMKAGGLAHIYGGVLLESNAFPIGIQATFGYNGDYEGASNGALNWRRFPIEALLVTRLSRFKFGAGLYYALSPKFSSPDGSIPFKNALGYTVQIGVFQDHHNAAFTVKYTRVNYDILLTPAEEALLESQGLALLPVNGDSVGIFAEMHF